MAHLAGKWPVAQSRLVSREADLRRIGHLVLGGDSRLVSLVGAPGAARRRRYLRDRDLQREINSGLSVAESWNRANAEIFYGKARDIASNRRDEQEMSVLCLHILQAAMAYVNTLMLHDVLAEDEWSPLLTSEDYRGLTPLTWAHVGMHGEFN